MQLVSLLGLVAMILIAWALSYHRRDIVWRPVVWGLGLQFLFALVILPEVALWSYLGLAVLALLLVAYLAQHGGAASTRRIGLWVGGGLALGLLAVLLTAPVPDLGLRGFPAARAGLGWVLLALVVLLVANGRRRFLGADGGRLAGAALVVLGVAWMIASGTTGRDVFATFSDKVASFLSLSDYGSLFLFGNLADPQYYFVGTDSPWPGFGFLFAFKVLPTIIFFGGFMAVLYYLGIMQKIIEALSRFMRWTIGTSGAETLSCSANIFVGQTEAPLLIKPFLPGMTVSELLTVMVGGFATIAGGVLAGYIAFGVPAGHLIAASVMSAPAALVIGKLIYPEKEHSQTAGDVALPEIETGSNVIEAASNGITDGLKLAVNVGAMLIGFIALIAVVDVILNFADRWIDGALLGGTFAEYAARGLSPAVGEYRGIFPGSLQTLFGTILRPLAWLMGVPWADAAAVGNLLGVKLSLNEFVAYGTLGTYIENDAISERAIVISTYALCGFANFSSIGIQIGGISAIAPERKRDLARVGFKAMLGGALASWLTATIAGLLIG